MSDHYAHTWPTARKPHPCELCRRTIRPGERYLRGVGMDGITAWTWRECAHCDAIRDLARAYGADGADGEYSLDVIAEWEPQTPSQLRALVLWRRQWTRRDGSLYPVPEKVRYEDPDGFGWQVDVKHAQPTGEVTVG